MSSASDSPILNDHCEQCHSTYTLLKKKKVCAVCRGNYCTTCAQRQRYQDQSYRICLICQLISNNSTTNDQLLELKVKQLKSFLSAKDISHNTCTEKQELVDLIARNRNKPFSRLLNQPTQSSPIVNNPSDEQTDSASNMRSSHSRPFSNFQNVVSSFTNQMNNIASNLTDAFSHTLSDVVNHSLGEQPYGYPPTPPMNNANHAAPQNFAQPNNPHGSSNRSSPSNARHRSQPPRGQPSPSVPRASATASGSTSVRMPDQRVRRKSLSDIHNENNIEDLNIRELKEILAANFVDFKGCVERKELIEKVRRLYRDRQNEKLKAKDLDDLTPGDTELCKICMDAIVDCVFLDCGHMVTCVKCGKLIAECPICRSNIVRVVRVFKS